MADFLGLRNKTNRRIKYGYNRRCREREKESGDHESHGNMESRRRGLNDELEYDCATTPWELAGLSCGIKVNY